jgi:hypothetical protein
MPLIGEKTGRELGSNVIAKANTGTVASSATLEQYLQDLNILQNAASIVRVFSYCSETTGGYVQLRPDCGYFPVLAGADNQMVPLYQFVEALDEVLDYDLLAEELPNLSYSQIGGAISFLRKLSQTNPKNIDLDRSEDLDMLSDPVFMAELKEALADEETSRVLNRG